MGIKEGLGGQFTQKRKELSFQKQVSERRGRLDEPISFGISLILITNSTLSTRKFCDFYNNYLFNSYRNRKTTKFYENEEPLLRKLELCTQRVSREF